MKKIWIAEVLSVAVVLLNSGTVLTMVIGFFLGNLIQKHWSSLRRLPSYDEGFPGIYANSAGDDEEIRPAVDILQHLRTIGLGDLEVSEEDLAYVQRMWDRINRRPHTVKE